MADALHYSVRGLLFILLAQQASCLMGGIIPDASLAPHGGTGSSNLSRDLQLLGRRLLLLPAAPVHSSSSVDPANTTEAGGASPPAAALLPLCFNPWSCNSGNRLCALILVPCLFPDNEDVPETAAAFVPQCFDPCAEVWAGFGTLNWDAWCEQHVWDANYRADMMHERLSVCHVAPSGQQQKQKDAGSTQEQQQEDDVGDQQEQQEEQNQQQQQEEEQNHQQQQQRDEEEQEEEQQHVAVAAIAKGRPQEHGWRAREPRNSTAGGWQWAASSATAPGAPAAWARALW